MKLHTTLRIKVLLKGLETDGNLNLIVWINNSRVRFHTVAFGSSCLDLEAHLWESDLRFNLGGIDTCSYFQIFGFISLSMVLISTTTFILQTQPELEDDSQYPVIYYVLTTTDTVVIVFFTIEYLIRLICCPRKIKFFFG